MRFKAQHPSEFQVKESSQIPIASCKQVVLKHKLLQTFLMSLHTIAAFHNACFLAQMACTARSQIGFRTQTSVYRSCAPYHSVSMCTAGLVSLCCSCTTYMLRIHCTGLALALYDLLLLSCIYTTAGSSLHCSHTSQFLNCKLQRT